MRSSLARKAISILLALLLSAPGFVLAQQPAREEGRPRRVTNEWTKPPTPASIVEPTFTVIRGEEPKIRVALATDVRTATISSTGRLLNSTSLGSNLVALNVPRLRLEPRLLSPATATKALDYMLKIEGATSRAEAEEKSREVRASIGQDSQVAFEPETKSWGLLVNAGRTRQEAEEMRSRLEDAGFDATLLTPPDKPNAALSPANRGVLLASRFTLPSREVVAFSSGSQLFSSSAPVQFASSEDNVPIRFNDRPYRGRIEAFTNTRGNLTIVNVLGLEDYVRGVIANELSPIGYPSLEALKAQAIAARTYAVKNRGQFSSQGFDLLPTTRSQVYRGLASEHPFSTRAVDETRGIIATHSGEPINALYTSTCGGRTEDSENIFREAAPYLRSHECGVEGNAGLSPFTIKTTREAAQVSDEAHLPLVRDLALLSVHNFGGLPVRLSDAWLKSTASAAEVRSWLTTAARAARQAVPFIADDANRPAAFATALNLALFGESRADALLNQADVEYFLAFRDAVEIPRANRADVALLLRDGHLALYPDATLRVRDPLSRGRVLRTLARTLEAGAHLQLQKTNARPATQGALVIRPTRGKDQTLRVAANAFLFRQIGEHVYPVSSVAVVGGETLNYHLNTAGEVDFLEVQPAARGASAERFSPFTNWTTELSLSQIRTRLARAARNIGPILDLKIAGRGASRRVIDLEIVGTMGTAHVRGGRIRSALGLREQLFVIDRRYDAAGQVTAFVFTGRGWGHGVGMCQVGAYGLARHGFTYDQILRNYYRGIELTKLY
ncbi:MAG TPA: SpoIID/LytB domain-containing protein [Pyrinomonadaceae bacterium]|nr:SpoIID/LytB domain-containing protein [Pyrinomonadaceae bacterium]